MIRLMCFKIHGLVVFHGLKQLLGRMVWLHRSSVKFVAILKESQSCQLPSSTPFRNMLGVVRQQFSFNIVVGDYFYCKDATHAKIERTYFVQSSEFVMTLIQLGIHLGGWKKFVQFVTVLHIFLHGRPMLEYESLRESFLLLKVKNTPLKHWSNSSGQQIAKAMHHVALSKTLSMIL